jgi:Ser/Thr protein kinase RdoA (MazF antagonist)
LDDFDQIVHYDLKPENIFLSDPDPLDNPHYPMIKVGDWGKCHHQLR